MNINYIFAKEMKKHVKVFFLLKHDMHFHNKFFDVILIIISITFILNKKKTLLPVSYNV